VSTRKIVVAASEQEGDADDTFLARFRTGTSRSSGNSSNDVDFSKMTLSSRWNILYTFICVVCGLDGTR